MDLYLLQKDVAQTLKISEACLVLWESEKALPMVHKYPAITSFLGWSPFKMKGKTLAVRIKNYRFERGLSHKKMGKILGVDPSTVCSWEIEECKLDSLNLVKINNQLTMAPLENP